MLFDVHNILLSCPVTPVHFFLVVSYYENLASTTVLFHADYCYLLPLTIEDIWFRVRYNAPGGVG